MSGALIPEHRGDEDPATDPDPAQAVAEAPYPPLPAHLEQLTERARDYVEAASSANTRRAYTSDWKHFAAWCRRQGLETFPPSPQVVGLYITAAYWFTASTSFANPAVTVAGAFSDTFAGIRAADVPLFIAAQIFGALAALPLCAWLMDSENPRQEASAQSLPAE